MATVYLSLGANLGDREKNIRTALALLTDAGVNVLKVSSLIETVPQGGPPQGLFLNAAARAETSLSPQAVLQVIHSIEGQLGRVRTVKNGPRPIDIDILFYDDVSMNTPELTIPHPRINERDFVLGPLKEIGKP